MGLLLTYLFLALSISFLCSIMEAVLLSASMSYLKAKEKNGNKNYKTIIKLKESIDKPLSAILSLNTVAHTVGAAGVGAQATEEFGEAYFGIVSAVLTILILIVTEIIPKTLGAANWKKLLIAVGSIIKITMIITYPLVLLSAFLTKLLSSSKTEQTISREEISALANIGTEEGVFLDNENKIIQNLIRLKKIKVTTIMTPRVVVSMADEKMDVSIFLKNKDYLVFSRIPVYSDNREHITGYVFRQDVLEEIAEKHSDLKLKDIKRNITVIPNTSTILGAWETLLEKKEHISVIIDEYGGMDGIVTMEDIIETLIGIEIVDEKDKVTDMQEYAREIWNKRKNKKLDYDKKK